jgi:hypothetical protein
MHGTLRWVQTGVLPHCQQKPAGGALVAALLRPRQSTDACQGAKVPVEASSILATPVPTPSRTAFWLGASMELIASMELNAPDD